MISHRVLVVAAALLAATSATAQRGAAVVDVNAIRNAHADEWLTYGRDYAETHYSPLAQINASNVAKLKVAWSWDIAGHPGALEATPLISNGVMYATGAYDVVFALDARTGAVKWRWDPQINQGGSSAGGPTLCCGPVNRGVALYRGKVYAGLLDGRLVALDAETGKVVWSKQTTPNRTDYTITGAPRIVKGRVIIGNGGAEFGVRGFIAAYDAETGAEAWRFYTVPGDPSKGFENRAMQMAASTWKGEWWRIGGGGTVWDAIVYDPDADLLYIGVGNGSPWSRDHRSAGTGDNLFLASIVALKPDNGEYVWHFQTAPGDDWDYTATQPIMLADLTIGGRARKVLMQAPKNGFFYVLDRVTGEFISGEAFAFMNWATGLDKKTGRPIESSIARYGTKGAWIAPYTLGAHNWHPMSFNPNTGLVYIPGQNGLQCHRSSPTFSPQPGQYNTGTAGGGCGDRPQISGSPGFLLAWDPVAQRERWRIPLESRLNGGTLTTAGNLVFSGANGTLVVNDATTGAKLWETRLGGGIATPVTYRLDGRQYVSVLAGNGPTARVWTFVLGE